MKECYYAKIPKNIPYDKNRNYFKEFEEKSVKAYEESDKLDDLEKFERISDTKFICRNFYIRTNKSKYKTEILKWFYNIVEYGFDYFDRQVDVIISMRKSLELDSFSIYIKFLNNESIEIDDESDLKFYEFIDSEFGAIMY